MNAIYRRLAALSLTTIALTAAASAAPVNVNFTTTQFYVSPPDVFDIQVEFYDSAGLYAGSYLAYAVSGQDGNEAYYTDISLSTDLPPGRYSFSITGFSAKYWTPLVTIGSTGISGSFTNEAFPLSNAPVDPPIVEPGNLLVQGSIEMEGRLFNMGTNPSNFDLPAFSLKIDIDGSTFLNASTSESASWYWTTPYDGNQTKAQMRLTGDVNSAALYVNNSQVLTAANASSLFAPTRLGVGSGVVSSGANSGAFGLGTRALAPNQFVVGQYNTPASGSGTTDPVFIVGNGQSSSNTSNAFLVSRNGDTRVAGKLIAGNTSLAAGVDASAIGYQANAAGEKAIAIGANTFAGGTYANVFGIYCQAHGLAATSIGFSSHATGDYSLAMGRVNFATGYDSYAIGSYNTASGYQSFAFGAATTSSGILSTTFGVRTEASGTASVALGDHTKASAYAQFVAGSYNNDSSNALLIIGNGTDADGSGPNPPVRGNAFEVRKDGSVHATVLRVRPAGDISMGEFEDGPEPFDP